MCRVASSTIKGFLYQFNVTLEELLNSHNEEIYVEGRIEDIDIIDESRFQAIQCKYHESQENFTISKISKAILQMLKNEKKYAHNANIKYKLYAYFPNLDKGKQDFSRDNLKEILETENKNMIVDYISHIIKIEDEYVKELINKNKKNNEEKQKIYTYISELSKNYEYTIDIENFFTKFEFYNGEKLEDLEVKVSDLLRENINNVSKKDILEIFYPNAIQEIANLSIKNESERSITKNSFLRPLRLRKETILNRWTKELCSYKEVLNGIKKRLHNELDSNYKERMLFFDADKYEDFNEKIVIFLKDFCDKYCFKPKLHKPITICISNYSNDQINSLIARLYSSKIKAIDGFQGNKFFPESFFRKPIYDKNQSEKEFKLRICSINNDEFKKALERNKPDIIYMISSNNIEELKMDDVKLERLEVKEFQDLYIIFKLVKG